MSTKLILNGNHAVNTIVNEDIRTYALNTIITTCCLIAIITGTLITAKCVNALLCAIDSNESIFTFIDI